MEYQGNHLQEKRKVSPYKIAAAVLLAALLIVLALGFLSGCAKTVDYSTEDANPSATGADTTGGSDGGTIAGVLGIGENERWEASVTATMASGETEDIDIKAEITVPDTNQMYVAEGTRQPMDEAYKEEVLKTFFGEGDIYYHDEAHWTKEEVQKVLAEKNQEYAEYFDSATIGGQDTLDRMEARIKQLESEYETASDDYTVATSYEVDNYIGKRDGILYTVDFATKDSQEFFFGEVGVSLTPYELQDVCPEDFSDCFLVYQTGTGDEYTNQCRMAQEDARQEADWIVSQLGLGGMEFEESWGFGYRGAKKVDGETELTDIVVNGYIFSYAPAIEGVQIKEFGSETDYLLHGYYIDHYTDYSFDSGVQVIVNDCGVISVSIKNPLQFEHVDAVSLLPFDTVCDLLCEELRKNGESYQLERAYYHQLDLIYMRVSPEEDINSFSYIPVWRLSNIFSEQASGWTAICDQPIFVNAIDGTVIRWDDVCPYESSDDW